MSSSAVRRLLTTQCPKLAGRSSIHTSALRSDAHYEHAEHMYEPLKMKNRKMKWGLTAVGFVAGGFGIPTIAYTFQQHKARGGG